MSNFYYLFISIMFVNLLIGFVCVYTNMYRRGLIGFTVFSIMLIELLLGIVK